MQLLEQRILTDGIVGENDVLKVGSFLNQQIDTQLLRACAEEFCRLFQGSDVTKVLTVEASGIAIATATAMWRSFCFCQKIQDKQYFRRRIFGGRIFLYP